MTHWSNPSRHLFIHTVRVFRGDKNSHRAGFPVEDTRTSVVATLHRKSNEGSLYEPSESESFQFANSSKAGFVTMNEKGA